MLGAVQGQFLFKNVESHISNNQNMLKLEIEQNSWLRQILQSN